MTPLLFHRHPKDFLIMCKFHEDIAIDIATDPSTGKFSAGAFAVARMVLARYHVEQYMPEMFGCDGRSAYAMASSRGRDAFARSGLERPLEDIQTYRDAHITNLHQAMAETASRYDLSVSALGLPKNPIKDPRMLDEGAVDLIEGYTHENYYSEGPLHLKAKAHKPEFEPLLQAAKDFLAQPGVEPLLKQMMENSLARNFIEARSKVRPSLMKLYELVPPKVMALFQTCASCSGSVVGPHLPCIGLMAAAGSSTTAAAIISNPIAVPAMSLLAAGSGYMSWNKLRSASAGPIERTLMKPAFVLAAGGMIAMHLPMFGHGHGGGHDHHNHGATTQSVPVAGDLRASWRNGLDAERLERIEQQAKAAGLSADEFMNPTCIPATGPQAQLAR